MHEIYEEQAQFRWPLTSSSFFYQSGNQILIISRVLAWCAPVEGEKPVVGHFMATACHQA